tara:strand:- start:12117 stop:12377 length:261 start_codon:yes stop_codon:yes gene_type:complete
MLRLTVHVSNPSFITKEQKPMGKDENNKPIMKPKKAKCIVNTITLRNLRSMKSVESKLSYIKSKYKIARWKEGKKKGKEMIYIAYH